MRLLLVLVVALLLVEVHSWRHFWKGKKFGLRHEVKNEVDANNNLPVPDQWFEQKLDHFNVINTKTWKQVIHSFLDFNPNVLNLNFLVLIEIFYKSRVFQNRWSCHAHDWR